MEVDKVLKEIRKQEKKGNIVFLTIDGFAGVKLQDFIQQPADGILYDLNRDKVVTITLAKAGKIDTRWVNDYAVAVVIEYIHEQLAEAKAENERLREGMEKIVSEYSIRGAGYLATEMYRIATKALESESK